jgi:predicted acylesterase/phospholipase RssA
VTFDAALHAQRRRPFERMEAELVRLQLETGDEHLRHEIDALRYVLAFGRLTAIRNPDGSDADVFGRMAPHAGRVRDVIERRLSDPDPLRSALAIAPELVEATREARGHLLDSGVVARDALELEVTTRLLAVASGGGGGAGYVYPGAFEILERSDLVPDLLVGTSIGAVMSLFRARHRAFTFAPLVSAARRLSWGGVLRMLETTNRYGMPGSVRLRLQAVLGELFVRDDGSPIRLSDTEIPLVVVATGLVTELLGRDLAYGGAIAGSGKALHLFRALVSRPGALRTIALGRDPGTEDFDAVDAIGFSSAVPGVLRYDTPDDPRMRELLDRLYARDGITGLGEGGLTSNVPARVAWETIASGRFGRRTPFVVALDCFAPNPRRIGWYPVQHAVRAANVDADRAFADLYVPFTRTLSPMNLVPSVRDAMDAVRWGRDTMREHAAFARAMYTPIPVLKDP